MGLSACASANTSDMPDYGAGIYSLLDEECVNSVGTALENGVRLIDTVILPAKVKKDALRILLLQKEWFYRERN